MSKKKSVGTCNFFSIRLKEAPEHKTARCSRCSFSENELEVMMKKTQALKKHSFFGVNTNFLKKSFLGYSLLCSEHNISNQLIQTNHFKNEAIDSFVEWFDLEYNKITKESLLSFKNYLIERNMDAELAEQYTTTITSLLDYMVIINFLSYDDVKKEYTIIISQEDKTYHSTLNLNNEQKEGNYPSDSAMLYQFFLEKGYGKQTIIAYFSNIRMIIKLMLEHNMISLEDEFITTEVLTKLKSSLKEYISNKSIVNICNTSINTLLRYISDNGVIRFRSFFNKKKFDKYSKKLNENKNDINTNNDTDNNINNEEIITQNSVNSSNNIDGESIYCQNSHAENDNTENINTENNNNTEVNTDTNSYNKNEDKDEYEYTTIKSFNDFNNFLVSKFKYATVNVYLSNLRTVIKYMIESNRATSNINTILTAHQLYSFKENLDELSNDKTRLNILTSSINVLVNYLVDNNSTINYEGFFVRKKRTTHKKSSDDCVVEPSNDLSNEENTSINDNNGKDDEHVFGDNRSDSNVVYNDDLSNLSSDVNDNVITETKDEDNESNNASNFSELKNILEKFKEDDLFDPFVLLNINPEDSFEFIKKQYRKSASLCHPDHNNDSVEARNIFVLINKSYKMVQNRELCDVYTQYKSAISNGLEYKTKILRHKFKSLVDEMIQQ